MTLLSWIVFGLLVGVLANLIDPSPDKNDRVWSLGVGAAGSLIGGIAANLVFGLQLTSYSIRSFLISLFSALLFLSIQRFFAHETKQNYKKGKSK